MKYATLQFAEFELDLDRYELRRSSRKVELERLPMELLVLLIDAQGRLVEREEIVEKLWGRDKYIDSTHGINTAVKKIRIALRDDHEQPRFIQTIKGRGYRFLGEMRELNPDPQVAAAFTPLIPDVPSQVQVATKPKGVHGPRWLILTLVLLTLLLGAVLFSYFRHPLTRASSLSAVRSLAVLPLTNLSQDPTNDYFADGLTDELTTDLAQMSSIRVISHTSVMQYKNSKKPLPDIGQALNVDAVVEGSVLQADRRVRVTTQLVDARTDRHIWAHSYTRDASDVLSIQTEVAGEIAHEIAVRLTAGQALAKQHEAASTEQPVKTYTECSERLLWFEREVPCRPGTGSFSADGLPRVE